MKPVLLDSDIIIEVMRRRNSDITARWEHLIQEPTPVTCTPVTLAELWHGARPPEFAVLEALFNGLVCIAIDKEVGRRAGDYLRQYAKSHRLQLGDALIAATASIHDLQLWTRNRKHYPMKDVEFF